MGQTRPIIARTATSANIAAPTAIETKAIHQLLTLERTIYRKGP